MVWRQEFHFGAALVIEKMKQQKENQSETNVKLKVM